DSAAPAAAAGRASPSRRGPAEAASLDQGGAAGILSALRRRRLALVACVVAIPALAALALHRIAPVYSASGTMLYDDGTFAAQELQSILRVDPTTDAVMSSQAEIARGLSIAERLTERLGLARSPEFNAALRPKGTIERAAAWLRTRLAGVLAPVAPAFAATLRPAPPPADPAPDPAAWRGTVLAVQASLAVATLKSSRVLEVSFASRDPDLAARAANMAMRLYIQDQLDRKIEAVRRATAWLEGRVAELRAAVRTNEDRIASFRAEHGLMQGARAGLDAERISRLNEDLLNARNETLAAQGRLDAARGRAGGGSEQAAIAPSVVQARAQRDQIAGQLQGLAAHLGANHPDTASLRSQLANADRSVAAETRRIVAASEAELRADRTRVAMLEDALRGAEAEQDRTGAAQVSLNAMQRDADAERTLLQSVQERLQQTAQRTAIETPDARIVSAALPPSEPSYPRRGPMMAAAAAAGVTSGLMLVYLLEIADGTLRGGEDLRLRLGLRCFALIPEVARRRLRGGRLHDYVVDQPLSPFAEQVRALRAGLWLGRIRPRIVAVTAARPSEGKTTVAIALARSAALAGERVVLLDCDIRQPSVGRAMGLDAEAGLTDCLQGEAALDDVIRRDEATGLAVIPSGGLEVNALSLFMSEAMAALLQTLRQEYDLILLDAPPAHALTDARVIAGMAEATLLCVRWRSTPVPVVRHALDLLAEAQASVVGAALTR
ncbi:MAG: AAA family ATPase, partial [Proteobacteria bacterium]|nr:AAA family ATPase [Pseudomonadota bacterium]